MDQFSISDLSRLSGVKPYTIRVWEKRYNALEPGRSSGNTRYYNNKQLRRLLNIVSLMEDDHKISKLSALSDEALFRLVEDKTSTDGETVEGFFIKQMISAGFTYDEAHFTNVFAQCLARSGLRNTYTRVIYPMLQRLGILWNADRFNASNEHFITNLLRQKLLTAIDLLPSPRSGSDPWLLFLPENEFHDAGLLVAQYLIRASGRKSVFLGSNLPLEALFAAAAEIRPANILFFFVHLRTRQEIEQYLCNITDNLKSCRVFVAGSQLAREIKRKKQVHFLHSIEDLEKALS